MIRHLIISFCLCFAATVSASSTQNNANQASTTLTNEDIVGQIQEMANRGDAGAQFMLSNLYARGFANIPKDKKQEQYWLTKAADSGNSDAQFYLASLYLKGNDWLLKNNDLAIFWILQAANKSHFMAAINLSMFYDDGKIIAQDPQKSYYWCLVAADMVLPEPTIREDLFFQLIGQSDELKMIYVATSPSLFNKEFQTSMNASSKCERLGESLSQAQKAMIRKTADAFMPRAVRK